MNAEQNLSTQEARDAELFKAVTTHPSAERVHLLIAQGANVNKVDEDGNSVLMFAVMNKEAPRSVIEALLDSGADVNAVDGMKWSVLRVAILHSRGEDIVELLINRGADINARDSVGISALMLGVVAGTEKVVELLIKRGADVLERDDLLATAIFVQGMKNQNTGLVACLLRNGVKPTAFKDGRCREMACALNLREEYKTNTSMKEDDWQKHMAYIEAIIAMLHFERMRCGR
jgi:ankyrin repeat protein